MVMRALSARFALILAICSALACGGGDTVTNPIDELIAAQMRWGGTETDSYSITLTRSCDCPAEEEGSVVINVEDGSVYSRAYTTNGYHVPTYLLPLFPSVWELFDIVVAARLEGPAPISEAYHPTYGYPTRIVMPESSPGAGDAATYEMGNLVLR